MEAVKKTKPNKRELRLLTKRIADSKEYLKIVSNTAINLCKLEKSRQLYMALGNNDKQGQTYYNKGNGAVIFSVGSAENFVHETTHGGQFEAGRIIFDVATGKPLLDDLDDETAAYVAQCAFDPRKFKKFDSLSKLNSMLHARCLRKGETYYNDTVSSMSDITPRWVRNLMDEKGRYVYDTCTYNPCGCDSANVGLYFVDIHSTEEEVRQAFPTTFCGMFPLDSQVIYKYDTSLPDASKCSLCAEPGHHPHPDLNSGLIDIERRRFDIDKNGCGTAIGNCIRCRDIGMTHGDDFVARRNSDR